MGVNMLARKDFCVFLTPTLIFIGALSAVHF